MQPQDDGKSRQQSDGDDQGGVAQARPPGGDAAAASASAARFQAGGRVDGIVFDLHLHLRQDEPADLQARDAAMKASEASENTSQWLARFVISYASQWAEEPQKRLVLSDILRSSAVEASLEDGALEEFALGSSRHLPRAREASKSVSIAQWITLAGKDVGTFANRLLRDYFLARKIAREVRAHGPDIFARYQFPQEHVLLFLAVIAPDVAAQATADHSAEMRARIREEIEHQLQLINSSVP